MMSSAKKKVVVGMSGGVDSSVAAYLLHQDKSLEVHGLYMNNWDSSDEEGQATCPADMEYESVRQVCRDIGISCSRVDFVQTYWNNVFAPCLDEYAQGFTPNPDVLCNREIKFDAFANHAKDIGADFIATGHYAQLLPIPSSALPDSPSNGNGVLGLFAAADSNKDQTYFLSHVSLAAFQKVLADRFHLPFALEAPHAGRIDPWLYSVESNAVMHEHDGFSSYTIGQGAKVSGQSIKWFVVGKRDEDAAVLIAPGTHHPALFADHTYVDASAFNWLVPPHQIPSVRTRFVDAWQLKLGFQGFADNGTTTFRCFYRARYRQPLAACTVTIAHDLDATSLHPMRQTLPTSSTFLKVEFDIPQRGLAPGQSLVLYRDDGLCFGGGAIYCAGPSYWEMQKPLPSPLYDWRS
ncbi:hypothetical protein DYB32_002298 [Aphanomyces invadans]|uniref:tRNA-5-taurinomethyluridine 2-sulfurtransferase n=1 Tax=Aphanomyces invadans TaxID=157072 RepID=A0A3R6VEU3_9STRA|nr:hypothetical protein DYB32_002298 [Aphanomyces invadans]